MTRAYSYLRVSGKSQLSGDGFERQRLKIGEWAVAHEVEIAGEYEERGVCGDTDWEDRPAWFRMIADITTSQKTDTPVEMVLIERLDRLARSSGLQEYILRDLRKRGIRIESEHEPDMATVDPLRKLIRQFLGAIAEYDKEMVTRKLAGARARKKAETGRCEGNRPYGSYPEEVPVVEMIRGMAGERPASVTRKLNDLGIKTRTGKKWRQWVVQGIVRRLEAGA